MSRSVSLLFSTVAYAIFFATFLYLIAFVGNLPLAALTVDRGPEAPVAVAVIIDLALIALFGIQHSVMARQGFKRAWTRIVPHYLERSIYVLGASAALIVMFLFWRPIPQVIWDAGGSGLEFPLWLLFASGWLVVLLSTFMINHFELFGLQQAWFHMRSREAQAPELRQPFFYRWVAHPLYAGFFISFWATPKMTAGHLLFALGMSVYILIAIRYEERDLRGLFGRDYEEYRATVGMLTPKLWKRAA
jgi:protein-S-isoprenylcysteine O-methyltransferase Ste14